MWTLCVSSEIDPYATDPRLIACDQNDDDTAGITSLCILLLLLCLIQLIRDAAQTVLIFLFLHFLIFTKVSLD